ncbi:MULTISPECIES: RidA family protein [Burkholderia]|uniref:RidA family protein n=1 Tax=Burkholderia vietnamiensis TaxID=60552 RepID=A0AAW7SZM8_BURVI|nr:MULTISPECIES: RidA family protein [Burkholderia]MCA8180518.1 RidA family protein [Burkholderia vietnamiensis]MCO1351003.1 RidA family protein [Burkholderia vietnamiensis]MCO1433794.1 RidA family protein [Burkholderia vietnamiensis]MDN7796452.1 RidA family protein [Burkholderia vietnamiensis]MDN8073066.1 RidA family protein [Burkholderia vietnamiensis]
MRNREAIIPAGMESVYDRIGYAPAIKVGDTVYVSGQIGRDAAMQLIEGREAQIVQAFENLKRVLEAGGATLDDVVDLTTFHTDMRDLPLFMQVRDRYFHAHPRPAWTAVGAHMLGGAPGYIVEIKAVAVVER